MISHDFMQIAEGFRSSDESDLIGSKLHHSPRNKGEFVPIKYSSSMENSRFFTNYAEKFAERQNPAQPMVVSFKSDPKARRPAGATTVVRRADETNGTHGNGTQGNGTHGTQQAAKAEEADARAGAKNDGKDARAPDNEANRHDAKEAKDMKDVKDVKDEVNPSEAMETAATTELKAQQEVKEVRTDEADSTARENDTSSDKRELGAENRGEKRGERHELEGEGSDFEAKKRKEETNGVPGEVPAIQIDPPTTSADPRRDAPNGPAAKQHPTEPTVPIKQVPSNSRPVPRTIEAPRPRVEAKISPRRDQLPSQVSASNDQFKFAKDLSFKSKLASPNSSTLSSSLMERAQSAKSFKGSKLVIPDYHVPCLQLVVFVLIHSSFLPNKLSGIRVAPNATVDQVIESAVKRLNELIERHRPDDPPLIPGKCQLLLAEEDGRPDTDTPVLQRNAAVHQFGCTYFALCKEPEADSGYAADSKTFKVVLPTKEYQVLSYKKSLSLGQVLEKVCCKRQLDPLVHYLVYTPANGNKDVEINLDMLVSDLDASEVTMKSRMSRKIKIRPPLRSRSRNEILTVSVESGLDSLAPPVLNPKLSRHLGVPKEFFWSPASVSTYVQYSVIKINKYGKKQERIMGIDRERITNSMPTNKPNKTNRPARMMTDVVRAYITDRPVPASPSSRKPFSIEFVDTIQEFESEKADEIVARINYIISLENTTPKPKQRIDD